ncbi:unnamed protein product [Brachionus calyciflorus]|uniref:Cadherin domain-containing protein n=1 Tax=Brachionus calyciflorus TaxID=104777 RepID=A0A813Q5G8_9BILA|nr:unnamed protein product [Brachionus calyciflorus]
MTNRILLGLVWLSIIFFKPIFTRQLTSLSKAEELRQIHKLKLEIDFLKKNISNFYNYSIVCGGNTYESRADQTFSDNTIPIKFKNFVLETYLKPENRANKCPKWSYNVETQPRSGGMDSLYLPENTKPGSKVYLLLAIDPESEPLFYFIRRAESETGAGDDPDDIIFKVNVLRMGNSWMGEVILDKELDYEKKQTYKYLTYTYDGSNLLEKYSTIEIIDVDDEKPEIKIDHSNYNLTTKQFEFQIYENVSIGEIINTKSPIVFTDTDTQSSQLIIRLTNFESGIADSPFSLNNNGDLRVISGLDYENQKEYLLKLNVRDNSGAFSEEIIKIEVLDVPDLPPKFIEPKNMMVESNIGKNTSPNTLFFNKQFDQNEEGYVLFYENKVGPVFNILAVSGNREPLGKIRYELIEDSLQMKGYFDLKKHSKNETWYLDCIRPISLNDKEEEHLQFTIRAIESDSLNYKLFTDKRVIVKVINGDMCLPVFDKELYEFEVVENLKQLLEPIYVSDCDHGINGRINLTTTNKDFSFKLDQVYRYSKLGIYMTRSYDYEQNLTADGHLIEFEIIARGNEKSLNKYETRALVRVKILDINEFVPRFVLPAPAYFLKDGIPTEQQQRIFLYNVPEGEDFVLDVKAEDQDRSGDSELFYFCRYLHPDDTFEIIHSYNSTSKLFNIRIPGRYFDSTYKIPITFAVFVEDSRDEPKLKNEIIIYLKPQSTEKQSAYFEFPEYEFKLKENNNHLQTFKLKILNENLNSNKITLEEVSDPLNLFSPEFDENWISKKDMISLIENETLDSNDPEQEVNTDLFVTLYQTNTSRDFDELFSLNNKSDIYVYKLRVRLIERNDLYNDVTVYFKLIDSNDNLPMLTNVNLNKGEYLNATMETNFVQNSLININDTHFIPKIRDLDFSDEFGLKSLHCRVNDTRFYMDNEYISAEIEYGISSISMLVRVLTNPDNINKDTIWLNVTCEDNYFNRKSNTFNSNSFLIKLDIVESDRDVTIFDKSEYIFKIDENSIGTVGQLANSSINKFNINYKIEGNNHEQTDKLNHYFYMNQNTLVLRQKLDYENSEKILNFSVIASLSNFEVKTDVVIIVNDINDESPKMSQNNLNIILNQNQKFKGMTIGSLYAVDLDQEDSEKGLNFTTSSNKIQLKEINTHSDKFLHGVSIILAEDLREDETYDIEIDVIDNNSHLDKCKLTIKIENQQIYDELKWPENEYQFSVKENTPENTHVFNITIQPIGLMTSKFTLGYKIVNDNPYFKINEKTGEITTTNVNLDRENPSSLEQSKQSVLLIQAYLKVDSSTYWSSMISVQVDVQDENDETPMFVQPSSNQAQISKFKPDSVFTFKATDLDHNDTITYNLTQQSLLSSKSKINLPFKIDSTSGLLIFNISELSNEDYMTLLKQEAEFVRVKLTIEAKDTSDKSANCDLLVDLSITKLLKQTEQNETKHLTPIIYKLEPKDDNLVKLNDSNYLIDESIQPNTIIAELNSYVSDFKLPLSESFKILAINDTLHSPELYFKYDYELSNLKLIRKLDYDLVKNLTLILLSDNDFRLEFNFMVNDTNDKRPELELNEQEMNKYGENLIVVSVNNLDNYINSISKVVSSTPTMPRKPIPAMPELNVPERRVDFMPYVTKELDENKNSLNNFDDIKLIKTYKIIDSDKENNFEVRFDLNATSEAVVRSFNLSTNGTHVLFEKNNSTTPEDEAILEENLHNRFRIELDDGKNKNYFNGELYRIDGRQLQRLSTFVPQNGRYRSSIYRSSLANTKINLEPLIQVENPFPYDIYVELEGKYAKLFNVAPRVIRSYSTVNFGPTELIISLKESLEDNEDEIVGLTSLDLSVTLKTKNDYLNILMRTIGNLKVRIDFKNENKYQPKIQTVEPSSRKITLDEGVYLKKKIARIEAYDNDRGDPGRLEYFLIGNSNLLEINSTSGEVYLNGTLDAESEQLIVFFCYARDLAPVPLGRNSELQRFEINVNDINEFNPIMQPGLSSLTLKEVVNEFEDDLRTIEEFRFDCYDRDLDSNLEIILNSIQYVSKHDTYNILDTPKNNQIKDLFKLVYDNSTSKNVKSAFLAYTNKLDYESLYKPNETLIRIDVSCTDGKFESLSKLIIKVEDLNDNPPVFSDNNLVINKDESNLLETITRIKASDADLSAQFGNQSLKYNIDLCIPNTYDIYIDERTGDISSKLLLDLDTDEVIEKRKQIHNNQIDYAEQLEFLNRYNKIVCQISVHDAGLYGTPSESSLSDSMNLTILINNMNDNPPDIRLDKQSENLIEVKEGDQTRGAILQKISVFDKDGASDLECVFGNGLKTFDPFEFRTSLDLVDPHVTWCILKVRDDMIVDYDIVKKSHYLLELVVLDKNPPPIYPNRGVSRAQIRVRVIPVNNKPPLFVNGNEETFNVLDSIRPNTLIGSILATDMENPNPDRLIYKFDNYIPKSTLDKFELRPSMNSTSSYWGSVGIFTTNKLEVSESPYILPIIAYDGPLELKDTLSSRKIVKINVLNKGSMSVWMNETSGLPVDYYSINLEEELPENTDVLTVKANIPVNSKDILNLDFVVYSIVSESTNDTNSFYKIDSNTGVIRTTGNRIDYEMTHDLEMVKQMRNLKVKATSSDGLFSYTTHVSINILDINDNKPKFEFSNYKFCVVENSTEQTTIGYVKAFDLDSGLNGKVKYKLEHNEDNLFEINSLTGEIRTLTPSKIDREKNSTLKLEIIAYDSDDLEDKIVLDLCVLDVNDNRPEFNETSQTNFEIVENSNDFKIKLNATDLDYSLNGTVYFYFDKEFNSIEVTQKFRVEPLTGLLELISPLDYDTRQEYNLIITCSDNGIPDKLTSNLSLQIKVLDTNDNSPKFTDKNRGRIYINEKIGQGEIVTKLDVNDADLTEEFKDTRFRINSIRYLKSSNEYITLDSELFVINKRGELMLGEGQQLDYQKIREYLIEIEAYDFNKPEFSDIFTLNVNLKPSNDKLPIFEHFPGGTRQTTLYRRSLAESRDNDYVVDIVKAVDPNQHGIRYYLDSVVELDSKNETKSYPNDLFSIGLEDGAVKTRKIRSFYSGDSYLLNIRAVSKLNDTLNSTTSLIVKIDTNSDSLFEERVFELTIDENISGNKVITQLKPKVINRSLRYKINSEFSSPRDIFAKWFKIDFISGLIETTNKPDIDCEITNEVLLSIDVLDEKKDSEIIENLLVKIKINDLNDNYPIFDLSYNYEPTMNEDDETTIDLERFITKFKALDSDRTLNNSLINYRIESVKNMNVNSFRLETISESNEVILYKTKGTNMDRDSPSIGSRIRILIRAENTYDPSVYTNKEITINLIDLNDNAPKLADSEPEVTITLAEDQKLGEKFYQIKAYDIDEINNVNSQLVYEITPKSSDVEIDSQGYLYLIRSLDYETRKSFDFDVRIYDKSSKPLFTSKKVKINVLNINDNYPKFENLPNQNKNGECSFSLVENMKPNKLYQLEASDRDFVENSIFEYRLVDLKSYDQKTRHQISIDDDLFRLDSRSGELFLNGELDREKYDNYILRLKVIDNEIDGKRLETSVDCYIKILDVNDNSPQFLPSIPLEYKILPLVNERTLIGYFAASDMDLGSNSTIEYTLKDNKNSLFEIDSSSYLFINLRKLTDKNHDLLDLYNLEISAKDFGVPERLETTLKITIRIDPNYFSFDQQKMDKLDLKTPDLVHLEENSEPGTKIGFVRVLNSFNSIINEAKSKSQNRQVDLKFSLLTCNDTFQINEDTGLIEVKNSAKLDYETIREFLVKVEARENQQMSSFSKIRTGVSSFMVKLVNLNDNPPVFSKQIYETDVKENQKLLDSTLTDLIYITDSDLDSPKSQAINQINPIEVKLNGLDSSNFKLVQVNPSVYKLQALDRFDYEFQKKYEFTLSAWDGLYKSTARVVVNILDENDNRPVFERDEYIFKIDENSPMGFESGQLKAIDLDQSEENKQIIYKITNTHENIFNLNERTGLLSVRDSFKLDRERVGSFNLTVVASNIGKPEFFDSTKVVIILNDINDETPRFDEETLTLRTRVNVREKIINLPKFLSKVHAVDNDLGENGTVNYFISSINDKTLDYNSDQNENTTDFFIDKRTGFLYLNSYLDADNQNVEKSYEIKITARDLGGNSEDCTVFVNLIDINDQQPIITSPDVNEFSFNENSPLDEPLFEVKAYDPDYRQSFIQYSLDKDLQNDWKNFRIDPSTGHVFSTIKFDYENKYEFNIKIICKDSGIMIEEEQVSTDKTINDLSRSIRNELITEYRVKIIIFDLDDNEPEFTNLDQKLKINVSENLEVGSVVTVIPMAVDRDTLPENTRVKYYLTHGNFGGKFSLNEKTGELILMDELERREKNLYDLTIQATSQNHLDSTNINEKSILNIEISVVKDKLFIEFDEQNYFVSVPFEDLKSNSSEFKMYKFDDQQSEKYTMDLELFKNSAIFYSKSHLIKRKLKRIIKFSIEMLQIVRQNTTIWTKLPSNLYSHFNHSNLENLNFASRLFLIDEANGKVFINRELVKDQFKIGDRFVLTISASSPSPYSDETENTITHLTVRLTDQNLSFMVSLKSQNLQDIMFQSLNPLKPNYVPRILQSDGVKIAIQDLLTIKSHLTDQTKYNLVVQVEGQYEQKNLDLGLYWKILKEFPSSNPFLSEFNQGFIDPRPVSNARQADRSDIFSIYRPFYSSWLFWLLFLIGCLLVLILVFFAFCVRQNHKQQKTSKKPGIIIEYPPGVNPMYNDGVLTLNNSKPSSIKRKIVPVELDNSPMTMLSEEGYEEKELRLDFDDECDE